MYLIKSWLTCQLQSDIALQFPLCCSSLQILWSSFFFTLLLCTSNPFLSFASPLSLFLHSYSSTPPVNRLVYILATGKLSAGVWHCNTHCPTMTMLGQRVKRESERGFIAERPRRVKILTHSSRWITVPLLLTGVCSSCWYSLGLSNLPGFMWQVKLLLRSMEASRRISSIKHVFTGAGDIPKTLREDWQQDTWLSTLKKKLTNCKPYVNWQILIGANVALT